MGEAKESGEIENIVTTFDEIFKEITLKTNNANSKEVVGYRQAILTGYSNLNFKMLKMGVFIWDISQKVE